MIIRSDWRGDGRKTSAPKRATSKRDAPIDIISMAQQARPKVIGQMELRRTQFTTASSEASTTPSCCCSPKVARSVARLLCSEPTRLSKRSWPVGGLSRVGRVRSLMTFTLYLVDWMPRGKEGRDSPACSEELHRHQARERLDCFR